MLIVVGVFDMKKFKTIKHDVVYEEEDLAVVRCEEREEDYDGNLVGRVHVWYDVCQDYGDGDIIESFKTLRESKNFIKYWLS